MNFITQLQSRFIQHTEAIEDCEREHLYWHTELTEGRGNADVAKEQMRKYQVLINHEKEILRERTAEEIKEKNLSGFDEFANKILAVIETLEKIIANLPVGDVKDYLLLVTKSLKKLLEILKEIF